MKKFLLASAVLAVLGASVTMTVMAQPPRDERPLGGDRPDGPPPEGRRRDGEHGEPGRPPMPNPLVAALDTNRDHEISAEEIQAATASLLALDKNSDGKLTDDEFRPPRPDGAGREGGPREGGPREGRPRERGPRGRAPRDGAGRGDGPPGRGDGPGPGPEGGPMGPPSPERFVEHAMHSDADGDGKLDESELMKFAEEFISRMGRPGGPGGEGGPRGGRHGGPGGERGPGGGRPGGPGQKGEGAEGERPRRPAAE